MNIFVILLALIVVGFLLFLVDKFLPMAPVVKYIFYGVVVIALLVWLLQGFGLISAGSFKFR